MTMLGWAVGWVLKRLFFAVVVLFSGMVVAGYRLSGVDCPARLEFDKPAGSIRRIIIRWGIKLLGGVVRAFNATEELLIQASADVGEWFIGKRREKAQAESRSRFL